MPNGRPRNRNSRHANRQRMIQQNQQVQAQPVDTVESVVVEAVPIEDTIAQLQQRIEELEAGRESDKKRNEKLIKNLKNIHKRELKDFKEAVNYKIPIGMNEGFIQPRTKDKMEMVASCLYTSESYFWLKIVKKYYMDENGNAQLTEDDVENIRKKYLSICIFVEQNYMGLEDQDKFNQSGQMVDWLVRALFGNEVYIRTRGIVLKCNKGELEDPDGNPIGELKPNSVDTEHICRWDEGWVEVMEDIHPDYDEDSHISFIYEKNVEVKDIPDRDDEWKSYYFVKKETDKVGYINEPPDEKKSTVNIDTMDIPEELKKMLKGLGAVVVDASEDLKK